MFLVIGLYLLWGFGWDTVVTRLRSAVEGTIVASRDVPRTGTPRYVTYSTVRGKDGREELGAVPRMKSGS